MASRLELHEELCKILGSRNVYYNPPESVKMQYDCIRYGKTGVDLLKANDSIYKRTYQYDLIFITKNPDSDVPDRILDTIPLTRFGRPYVANGLDHFPMTVYY